MAEGGECLSRGLRCGRCDSWVYLIVGERLHPKAQPRELSVDNPQLVFRVGFVEPVDVLLGLLKELVGGLGRHRTSGRRTATVRHDKPSLRTEIR